uniref:Uncharacterized protein n=1 Tax=Trichobilharzia regenti TaxID=157069 RepID=A0AA85K324_TRIRE|nr:unnamed protein product [Trichobilharzia regenti]
MGRPSCAWGFQRNRERFKHLLDESQKNNYLSGKFLVIPAVFPQLSTDDVKDATLKANCLSLLRFEKHRQLFIDDNQFTVLFKDENGNRITLPKLLPNFYDNLEVIKRQKSPILYKADEMPPKAINFVLAFLKCIEKEKFYYAEHFSELIRQETVQCYDRGKLLAKIRMFYKNFFESIPIRFLNLCNELFCQELLYKQTIQLNDKYAEETNRVFRKLKMITECNEIYKTEEEELRTKFKAKLSEASMTEYLLNEFKSCYEYQRKLSEDRLKDMQDDNEMSNYVLKVLNYYIFTQLSNIEELNLSNLAQACFNLQQVIEIWGFIGIWFVQCLQLYDTIIINKIDKLIQNDWFRLIESVEKQLDIRDKECRMYVHELEATMKSLDEYGKTNSSMDTRSQVKFLSESLSNLLKVANSCLDMFNGECVLNIEDNLKTIEQIHNQWFELLFQSSHYAELMMTKQSTNYEQEVTVHLQKELQRILRDYRIRLQGENGIVQHLAKLIRSIEDYAQSRQLSVTTEDDENSDSYKVELFSEKLWQNIQHYSYWADTIKQILTCVGKTNNCLISSSKQIHQSNSVNDEFHEKNDESSERTSLFDESDKFTDIIDLNLSKCHQHVKGWFELMKNRVISVGKMRIDQIKTEQVNTIQELNKLVTNNYTFEVKKQENNANKQNNQVNKSCQQEKKDFYELTMTLIELGTPVVRKLVQENIDGYNDHDQILSLLKCFELCAVHWCELLDTVKTTSALQTFKNVKKYLNAGSNAAKFAGISEQSIIRYLQANDWTVREYLLADTRNGQPIRQSVTNRTDEIFPLPKDLPNTKLASSALLKQNEYRKIIINIENETIAYENETILIEEKWINACTTEECLQQQIGVKQNELKRLEEILQIKMEVLDDKI